MAEKYRGGEGSVFNNEEIDIYESIKQDLIDYLLSGRENPEYWPYALRQYYEKSIVPEVNTVWANASSMLTKNLTDTELITSLDIQVWLESMVSGQNGGDYMLLASYCSDELDKCTRIEQIAKLANLSKHMSFAVSQEEIGEIRKDAINAHCRPGVGLRFDVFKVVVDEPLEIEFNEYDETKKIKLFDSRYAISLPGESASLYALDPQANIDSFISEAKPLAGEEYRSVIDSIVAKLHKNQPNESSENVRVSAILIEMMCREMAAAEYLDDFIIRFKNCQRAMVNPEPYSGAL